MMVGEVAELEGASRTEDDDELVLKVEGLTSAGRFRNVDLNIRQGAPRPRGWLLPKRVASAS